MATVTPNYSWPVPTSGDLVKDGATAIEALGDAIDATVFGLGSSGFVKLSTGTFSSVATVSAAADTFTSTYDAYKLIINITSTTADGDLYYKNRLSGTDASTSYYSMRFYADSFSSGSSGVSVLNNGSYIQLGRTSSGSYKLGVDVTIYRPKIADQTIVTGNSNVSTGASAIASMIGGAHTTATAYDSFTIGTSGGNITGNYTIYGLAK